MNQLSRSRLYCIILVSISRKCIDHWSQSSSCLMQLLINGVSLHNVVKRQQCNNFDLIRKLLRFIIVVAAIMQWTVCTAQNNSPEFYLLLFQKSLNSRLPSSLQYGYMRMIWRVRWKESQSALYRVFESPDCERSSVIAHSLCILVLKRPINLEHLSEQSRQFLIGNKHKR